MMRRHTLFTNFLVAWHNTPPPPPNIISLNQTYRYWEPFLIFKRIIKNSDLLIIATDESRRSLIPAMK